MPQHIRLREVRCQQSWPSPTIEVSVSSLGLRVNLIPTERADIESAPTDKRWSLALNDYPKRCRFSQL